MQTMAGNKNHRRNLSAPGRLSCLSSAAANEIPAASGWRRDAAREAGFQQSLARRVRRGQGFPSLKSTDISAQKSAGRVDPTGDAQALCRPRGPLVRAGFPKGPDEPIEQGEILGIQGKAFALVICSLCQAKGKGAARLHSCPEQPPTEGTNTERNEVFT